MRKSAVFVIATMAGVASAQDLTLTFSNDAAGLLLMGDTVTVTVAASWTPDPGFGMSNCLFDINGDDALGQTIDHDETSGLGRYFQMAGTLDGTTTGDDILGIDEFQLPAAFGGGDPTNPITAFYTFTYTVTDDTMRTVTYDASVIAAGVYTDTFGTSIPYAAVITSATSFDIGVPAPASAALLGLGGLVATRRRR